MTTPDPTLAARLAEFSKSDCRDNEFAKWCQTAWTAYSTNQLITTAEADARVKAAVLAERERAKRADCDAFSNPLKDCC